VTEILTFTMVAGHRHTDIRRLDLSSYSGGKIRTTVNSPVEAGYRSLLAQLFIFGLLGILQLKINYT